MCYCSHNTHQLLVFGQKGSGNPEAVRLKTPPPALQMCRGTAAELASAGRRRASRRQPPRRARHSFPSQYSASSLSIYPIILPTLVVPTDEWKEYLSIFLGGGIACSTRVQCERERYDRQHMCQLSTVDYQTFWKISPSSRINYYT